MANILVIDDDAVVRAMIGRVLERAGHAVVSAGNGVQGMHRFREAPFDLVITDLYMPESDGMETIQAIRAADADVPIVAMSGGLMGDASGPLGDAALFGANATLQKPFENERLVRVVADLIR